MTNAQKSRTTREKAAALRAEAAAAQARRRARTIAAVVGAVVLVLVGAVVVVQQTRHDQVVAAASQPSGVPRNLLPDGGIAGVFAGATTLPAGKTPVTVELWEDLQCPSCRAFEAANGTALERWAKQGVVRLVYKPVSFLDRASTTQYSSRALNAAAAVVDTAPEAFPAFHDLLYANQPAEGTAGLTDTQLVDYAAQAGAPRDAVASALAGRRYQGWIVQRTDEFSRRGFTQTPTVVVDGTVLGADDPAGLEAAVAKAAAARGLPVPD